MPVELDTTAEELAQALVHVRPGATAVEGQEDKLENQRHGALVALLACAPLSSIVVVTQEVFSPHLDISQRLLLLDAMSGTRSHCQRVTFMCSFREENSLKTCGCILISDHLYCQVVESQCTPCSGLVEAPLTTQEDGCSIDHTGEL